MSRYIGVNKLGTIRMGGVDSSYSGYFDKEQVLIESGIGDIVPVVMGDVSNVCEAFVNTIKENNVIDFNDICKYLYSAVDNYFGDFSNVRERLSSYKTLDDIETEEDISKVSSIKGLNRGMCVERAMLTQNLLKTLGINSIFKASAIEKDGRLEGHAYNLAEYNGKYYLIDNTIPAKRNGQISPVITEVNKEIFEKLSSSSSEVGYSVRAKCFSVAYGREYNVVYDPGREKEFDSTKENISFSEENGKDEDEGR